MARTIEVDFTRRQLDAIFALTRQEPRTPPAAATILLRRRSERPETEQATLVEVRALHAELDQVTDLSEQFTQMICDRHSPASD